MLPQSNRTLAPVSVHYQDPNCPQIIGNALADMSSVLKEQSSEEIILCIGTDRSTGDCLGPLVGTNLKHIARRDLAVYGTLEEPVHALNLASILDKIKRVHAHPFIIAIDACLGKTERIGNINIKPGALYPGTALKKSLPPVGDVHISGIVNVGGFMEHIVLQNTRLGLVYKMAESIARGLAWLKGF